MDHNEAVRLQAAEKYVLGEFPKAQRDEFEEHFFDCAECALDMKAAAAFVDVAREVLRDEREKSAEKSARPARGDWFGWLRPVVAVPAFAALLLLLGYQSFVNVPRLRNLAVQSAAPRVLPMFSLIAANSRGSESAVFRVQPGERFGLYVDVPATDAYSNYLLRLDNPAGHSAILSSVSRAEAGKTQVVEVSPTGGFGVYQIVVLGLARPDADPAGAATLATMKFTVEFIQ